MKEVRVKDTCGFGLGPCTELSLNSISIKGEVI